MTHVLVIRKREVSEPAALPPHPPHPYLYLHLIVFSSHLQVQARADCGAGETSCVHAHLDPEQVARQQDVQIHYGDGAMSSGHKVSRPRAKGPSPLPSPELKLNPKPKPHPHSPHQASYAAEVEQHERRTRQRGRQMFTSAQWLKQARPEVQCLPHLDARHGMGNCVAGATRPTLTDCHQHLLYRHTRAPSSASMCLLDSLEPQRHAQAAHTARWWSGVTSRGARRPRRAYAAARHARPAGTSA